MAVTTDDEEDSGTYRDFSGAVIIGAATRFFHVIMRRRAYTFKPKYHRVGATVVPYCPDPDCPAAGALLAGNDGIGLHSQAHEYLETEIYDDGGAEDYETAGPGDDGDSEA